MWACIKYSDWQALGAVDMCCAANQQKLAAGNVAGAMGGKKTAGSQAARLVNEGSETIRCA